MKGSFMENTQYKNRMPIIFAILMVLSGIAGITLSALSQGAELFVTYTEDSNILNLITSVIYLLLLLGILKCKSENGLRIIKQMRYISTCCVGLTFFVVLLVLAPMSGGIEGFKVMFFYDSMFFNHLVTPVLAIISFVFFEKEPILKKVNSLYALIPTIIYGAIAIVLNIVGVLEGPYPFLRVKSQSVLASILWIIAILLLNYLLARFILYLNQRKSKN